MENVIDEYLKSRLGEISRELVGKYPNSPAVRLFRLLADCECFESAINFLGDQLHEARNDARRFYLATEALKREHSEAMANRTAAWQAQHDKMNEEICRLSSSEAELKKKIGDRQKEIELILCAENAEIARLKNLIDVAKREVYQAQYYSNNEETIRLRNHVQFLLGRGTENERLFNEKLDGKKQALDSTIKELEALKAAFIRQSAVIADQQFDLSVRDKRIADLEESHGVIERKLRDANALICSMAKITFTGGAANAASN